MPRTEQPLYEARAAWWEDGIPETLSGLTLIILGSLGWAWSHMEGTPTGSLLKILWALVLLGSILLLKPLMFHLKARWSWDRTGYSLPRRELDLPSVLMILGAMGSVILAVLSLHPLVQSTGIALFVVLLMGSLYRYARLVRFLGYAVLAGTLSLVAGLTGMPPAWNVHLTLAILGGGFLLSGVSRLFRVLKIREHPHG